jgi:hypothetical protein
VHRRTTSPFIAHPVTDVDQQHTLAGKQVGFATTPSFLVGGWLADYSINNNKTTDSRARQSTAKQDVVAEFRFDSLEQRPHTATTDGR